MQTIQTVKHIYKCVQPHCTVFYQPSKVITIIYMLLASVSTYGSDYGVETFTTGSSGSCDSQWIQDFKLLDNLMSNTSNCVQAETVRSMVRRLVGSRAAEFLIVVDKDLLSSGKDLFKIVTVDSAVEVTGSTGVAAAYGVYYYLKNFCHCQFTWAGQKINLPIPLPHVFPALHIDILDRFRYYQNVCTVSYSSAFWDWAHWERHIDWMALHGINLPLAFTGQEAIVQRLYRNMGFSQEDMDRFFGGPAFLAWSRMGNINGWGGPLPQGWILRKLVLQHKILQRMRDFGMIPVLPGFSGHVPQAITRVFPNANVSRFGSWCHFNKTYSYTYLLDFEDPLFEQIGSTFVGLMKSEFGVDHVYNADIFNEITPKSNSVEYLSSAGTAVFNGLRKVDPDAVWLMQGWLFRNGDFWKSPQMKALINSVPRGRMIILDLMSELAPLFLRTESYYGQPFIWCMLHNFGGTSELYGDLGAINDAECTVIPVTKKDFDNSCLDESVADDCDVINMSVYNSQNGHTDMDRVLITRRPQLKYNINATDLWYDPQQLYAAWKGFLLGAVQFQPNELYRYDLVDVTRNSLQVLACTFYYRIVQAFHSNNSQQLMTAGGKLLDLLADMETLLASDQHFLFGTWLRDAMSYGDKPGERFLLQMNLRNQITIWGPDGQIVDYASKQWSGVFKDYYIPRWSFFITWLTHLLANGRVFDVATFNRAILKHVERPFTWKQTTYPTKPSGDSMAISKELYMKYKGELMEPHPLLYNGYNGDVYKGELMEPHPLLYNGYNGYNGDAKRIYHGKFV